MILTAKLTTSLLHLILELHQNCILTLCYLFTLVANPGLEMHTYFLFYEQSIDSPIVHTIVLLIVLVIVYSPCTASAYMSFYLPLVWVVIAYSPT